MTSLIEDEVRLGVAINKHATIYLDRVRNVCDAWKKQSSFRASNREVQQQYSKEIFKAGHGKTLPDMIIFRVRVCLAYLLIM